MKGSRFRSPDPVDLQAFAKFSVVGAAAATSYAAIATALVRWQVADPFTASLVTYAAIIPLAYASQRRFTFRSKARLAKSFTLYSLVQILALTLISQATLRFITGTAWLDAIVFLATAGVASILSFFISTLIFRSRDEAAR